VLKTVLTYGIALAAGAVALIAAAFLGLGIWVGRRLFRSESRAGP
jgi:hypothetical protein